MSERDYYAPGTYNDPNAPWNQDDRSEEITEKQWEMYCDRLNDEPDVYIAEGITEQASDKAKSLYNSVQRQLKVEHPKGDDDMYLGGLIRKLVQMYATPSEDEALEKLNR